MRGTGKTFRRVLVALKLASEGENVKLIVPTNNAGDYVWNMASSMVYRMGMDRTGRRSFKFPNNGHFAIVNANAIREQEMIIMRHSRDTVVINDLY